MARNCTVDRLLACYEYDSIEDLIPSLFWLEDWEEDYDPQEGTGAYYGDEFGHRRPFNVYDDSLPPFVELPDGTKVFHSIEDDAVSHWLYTRVEEEVYSMYNELYEYWDDEPAKKVISDYWYKHGDELIENARKFLEQEDAKVGIIFDPDFLNKQNAA